MGPLQGRGEVALGWWLGGNGGWDGSGAAARASAPPPPPQAGPMVADQRGPELRLHHPSAKGPQAHGRRLLTSSPFI